MATILERIGAWAADLTLERIPARVVDKVRLQVATTTTAAALAPWHEPSLAVLRAKRSAGGALVFATGDRLAPPDAAFVNAAFAMSLDYDDYMLSGHMGHSAVLVPLAHAQSLDEVIVAATAADEAMGRLSSASLMGPLNGQMSSYVHNLGAALALGKVRKLSADQLVHAMALALSQPNHCLVPAFWHEGAKTLTASMPIAQGMQAAALAEAGLTGPADVLDHPLGFASAFAFAEFPGLFEGFGDVWFADTLSFKKYPGTSYVSAAVEGALELSGGTPLSAGDIDAVEVDTTLLSSTLDRIGAQALDRSPLDANAVNFSLRLSVAAALCFGDLRPEDMRPGRLAEAEREIRAIAAKVHVVHDWSQSLRLIAEAPVGAAMLTKLGPAGALKAVHHVRRMGRAAGQRDRPPSRMDGNLSDLQTLVSAARQAMGGAVRARDLDLASFRMLQSARTTLVTGGTRETTMVDVPIGACGRSVDEARDLVRWRWDLAFGERAEDAWPLLMEPGHTVTDLAGALSGR